MRSLKRRIVKAKREKQIQALSRERRQAWASAARDLEEIKLRVELIQMLIPIGLMHVNDLLQQEVEQLAGPRYARAGGVEGYVRWGRQGDRSIWQKMSMQVPQVRDARKKEEI